MERQYLCFVTGADEGALLRRIDEVDEGLVVLPGKYVSGGDAGAILDAPASFDFRQAVRSQRRLYLAHRAHARELVLHEVAEGPLAGWRALDALRSEVFELSLPAPVHGRLAPARLAASVVGFEGYEKRKKSAAFGRWVARVLRGLEEAWPATSVDFVHAMPGALAFAERGGQLTYLEEPVRPTPEGRPRQAPKERLRG